MKNNLGYTKSLFIQPFDHRASFMKKMFGIDGRQPTPEETKTIAAYKQIVYEGFKRGVELGVPKDAAAILVDEQFGDAIIRDAVRNGFVTCVCTEKSGQDEFDFEYGKNFQDHLTKYRPTFAKALIRYNPEESPEMNKRQQERLKQLSDFCHANNLKFIIEPLVPATKDQLASVGGDQRRYDNKLRPKLMVGMVAELQVAGVEPDVWKIEGLEKVEEYKLIIKQMRADGRDTVSAIVLGRGAGQAQVETWLKAGAKVDGIIGFAIGRTVFWDPLTEFKDGKISAKVAAEKIGQNYLHFYQFFEAHQ